MTKVAPIQVNPLSGRNIMRSPAPRKGWRQRWVKNVDDQIDRMLEAGYVPVRDPKRESETDSADSFIVKHGTDKSPGLVLMEIPEALFNARAKMKVDAVKAERAKLSRRAQKELAEAGKDLDSGKYGIIGGIDLEGGPSKN